MPDGDSHGGHLRRQADRGIQDGSLDRLLKRSLITNSEASSSTTVVSASLLAAASPGITHHCQTHARRLAKKRNTLEKEKEKPQPRATKEVQKTDHRLGSW